MSKTEEKIVTVALNCSVKVSGTLYAPDDVIKVTEDIARRLIEQKAADPYIVPAKTPEADQTEEDLVIDDEVDLIETASEPDEPAKGKDAKKPGKPAAETAAA